MRAQPPAHCRHLHRLLAACAALGTFTLSAQAAGDPLGDAGSLSGTGTLDPREVIIDVMVGIVKYTALLATIAIIIGGIYMIVGGESGVERGKKILLYTVAGMLIILLAGAIVGIFTMIGSSASHPPGPF